MKTNTILLLFLFVSLHAYSQELRFNAYADYMFQDRFSSYYSGGSFFEGKVEDGLRWGGGVEFMVGDRQGIELQYLRQDTKAPTTYRRSSLSGTEFSNFDLGLNYIMVNSLRYFPVNPRVEPFFGGGIGIGFFNVKDPVRQSSDSGTKFTWQIRGGTNLWLSPQLGLRLQASLLSMVQAVGGGLYFGTGGSGVSLNSYSTIYQFGLGGGLVFRSAR